LATALVVLLMILIPGMAGAQTILTDEEQHAAYCFGVTSERYDGYFALCRSKGDQCLYANELTVAEVARQPHIETLKRLGLYGWSRPREVDGALVDETVAAGVKDYRACFDYFTRVFQTCSLVCAKRGPECQPACEKQGSGEACKRLEACLSPIEPPAAAKGAESGPARRDK
jgi:hypothetical protein